MKQEGYVNKILKEAGMETCNPTLCPMESSIKSDKDKGGEDIDATACRRQVCCLRYLLYTSGDELRAGGGRNGGLRSTIVALSRRMCLNDDSRIKIKETRALLGIRNLGGTVCRVRERSSEVQGMLMFAVSDNQDLSQGRGNASSYDRRTGRGQGHQSDRARGNRKNIANDQIQITYRNQVQRGEEIYGAEDLPNTVQKLGV